MTSKTWGSVFIAVSVASGLAAELGAMWLNTNQGGMTPYVLTVMVLNGVVLGFMVGGVLFLDQGFRRGEDVNRTTRLMGATILMLAGAISVLQAVAIPTEINNGVGYYTFWNYLDLAIGGFQLIGGALALYNKGWGVSVAAGITGYITMSFAIAVVGIVLIAMAHMNEKRSERIRMVRVPIYSGR